MGAGTAIPYLRSPLVFEPSRTRPADAAPGDPRAAGRSRRMRPERSGRTRSTPRAHRSSSLRRARDRDRGAAEGGVAGGFVDQALVGDVVDADAGVLRRD